MNQNGRRLGPKGQRTRARLIQATVALISTTKLRDLRVADIAREAGTSPGTFYVYFPEVSDAVLAALDELTHGDPRIIALVDADWSKGDAVARAIKIVEAYLAHWLRHNALYRVRNLAADEGDVRFIKARAGGTIDLHNALTQSVARARFAGWVAQELDPFMTAGVLLMMLERFAATQVQYDHSEVQRAKIVLAAAHVLAKFLAPPQATGPVAADIQPH